MINKQVIVITLLLLLMISVSACRSEEPVNVSVDGAIIETGLAIDDDLRIISPQTTFKAGEDFYFYFYNNGNFNSERLTVQLVDSRNEKVLAEHTYEVEPGENSLTDGIFFGNPGSFLVTVRIDGLVRATRQIIIE